MTSPRTKRPDETDVHLRRMTEGPASVPHLSLYRENALCTLEGATYYGEEPDKRLAQTPGTTCLLVGIRNAYFGTAKYDSSSAWNGAAVVQFEVLFPDGTGGCVSHMALTPVRMASEAEIAEFTNEYADKCVESFKDAFEDAPQHILVAVRQVAMKVRSPEKLRDFMADVMGAALHKRMAGGGENIAAELFGKAKPGVDKQSAYDAALASLNKKKDGGLVS